MKLKELINSLDNCHIEPLFKDFAVKGISCNSKQALEGFVFVAVKGTRADGHNFIEEAISKGAKAVVIQCGFGIQTRIGSVSVIRVDDTRKALIKLAVKFYGDPSSKLKVVAITGTNGKTTISYLMEAILKEAEFIPAVFGTINYRFKNTVIPSWNTTPGILELQSMLAEMLKEGVNYAIMEVSSHALDQERAAGINFHSAIFTNLTQDHLDYHHTMENYFQAKAKLFKNISPKAFVVINTDDSYGRRLKTLTSAKIITYGLENRPDVFAKALNFDIAHTEFTLVIDKRQIRFKTQLIGRYNVYNILAGVCWGLEEGLDLEVIKSAIEKFNFVPGRLERINFNGDFAVFIDYAHTEDALKNVIAALRQFSRKRIIVAFGCGGERDKTKRPRMGRVVSELSDYAIITNDNPRSEDPEKIARDIRNGIAKDNYCVILDRQEAIRKSLSIAKPGDIVLVAGKGHENYQILKNKKVHFDDREVIRECLKSANY